MTQQNIIDLFDKWSVMYTQYFTHTWKYQNPETGKLEVITSGPTPCCNYEEFENILQCATIGDWSDVRLLEAMRDVARAPGKSRRMQSSKVTHQTRYQEEPYERKETCEFSPSRGDILLGYCHPGMQVEFKRDVLLTLIQGRR